MKVRYTKDDHSLTGEEYLHLLESVWGGKYDVERIGVAIGKTLNITARHHEQLVGCVRILTDGYFHSTITEILVASDYQGKGIGKALMDIAWELSPTSLYLESGSETERFFEGIGFSKEKNSYVRLKGRGADF